MAQSGYNYQQGAMADNMVPTAPPMGNASAEDGIGAPPSYEEALRASGASQGCLWSVPASGAGGDAGDVGWHPGVMEAGAAGPGPAVTVTADPPPQATNTAGHSDGDAPPSYQSLFGQIKEAKQSSSGVGDFISKLFLMPLGCLIGLVLMALCAALLFGVPVTLLSVGSYYMYDCPLAPGVPVWMVVGGVIMLLHTLHTTSSKEDSSSSSCLTVCAVLFYIAWYIAGAVLIYPNWQPPFEPAYEGSTNYCNYTLFMTAFVLINLMSVTSGVICCMGSV